MAINYNLTGSERKALVGAIANKTGLKAKYRGMPSMAYDIGPITIDKTGGMTWSDEATDSEIEYLVEQLAELGFEAEVELEDETPGESDKAFLSVSIPADSLSPAARNNLQLIVKAKGELIKKAVSADELPILYGQGEINFPWFNEAATPEESHAFMELISKLCDYAKTQKRVTASPKEVENEKYAFRCFLLRLGFIGDEYKTDRKVLLRNFTGSSAFKSGTKKEYAPGLDPIPTPENTVTIDVEEAKRRLQDPAVQAEIRAIINGEDGDGE